MREVIIHIGMHKTGSTSIQDALRGYKDKKTRYASFSQINHSIPIYTVFSKRRYKYHIWKNLGLSKQQIDQKVYEYAQILESDLCDKQYERLVVSGEDISTLDREEMHELVEVFHSKGLSVRIVMFVRQPVSLVSSVVQELIKNGHRSFGQYNLQYESRIQPFREVLPSENITVEDFDSAVRKHSSIVKCFASLLDIARLSEKHSNESMSIQAVALVYKLNNIPLQVVAHPNRYKARSIIVEHVRKAFSLDAGFEKPDPEEFACLLGSSSVERECLYLKENFGISYEEKPSQYDPDKLIDYFNQSLVGFDREIENFFRSMNVAYKPQEGLEGNFLEAIVKLIERKSREGHGSNILEKCFQLIRRQPTS